MNKQKRDVLLEWLDYFYNQTVGGEKIPPCFLSGMDRQSYMRIRQLVKALVPDEKWLEEKTEELIELNVSRARKSIVKDFLRNLLKESRGK